MRKKIIWEKWKDPLLSNYDENEWPGHDLDEDGDTIPIHSVQRQPIMHTPFGVISVVDDAMASSSFDFWMMHTNFDITEGIANVLSSIPGVETLEVYTRYRARVGFPHSGFFKPGEVWEDINNVLRDLDYYKQNQILIGLDLPVAELVIKTRDKIDKEHDYWAILVIPNGKIEIVCSDKCDTQYNSSLKLLKEASESIGGRLLTSESE